VQIFHAGDVVRARRETWRVADVRTFDGCRLLALTGTGGRSGTSCELLTPFDLVEHVTDSSPTPRRVGIAPWRRAARALIGRHAAPGLLRVAADAQIDLLPHQLEPAVAILRGDGCRVLLADDVGLGKTIQACVAAAELRARAAADRILILTPPGLRDQWKTELSERFHLEAETIDARTVRRRASELPPDVNPWSTWPVAVASIDYVKRPEVLRAAVNCRWDVVVVDEAHRVANDGDRRQAAEALSSRAAYVLLLTATPHSGDAHAFASLCSLGSHGDRLLVFRRTRAVMSAAVPRRVHRLYTRSTADERRMHLRLEAFARAVAAERGDGDRDMWIALALLRKRACSSAKSLELSVSRRLDALSVVAPGAVQLALPLDEDGDTTDADQMPAWQPVLTLADSRLEHRLLTSLAAAAGECARHESKISVLRRLIRRVREPLIIFTEYRDTLAHVASRLGERCAILHGGLTRAERIAALAAFASGRPRILLATDAASEGLNLHHTCRGVVNLELPWNPMRLEQRIGRVDRIGQTRTVHAFHLIGRDGGERLLLDNLRRRIADAQAAIGAADPLDGALGLGTAEHIGSDTADAGDELMRLRLARALSPPDADDDRPLRATARNPRTRARLQGRTFALWEYTVAEASDRVAATLAVGVLADSTPAPPATQPLQEQAARAHRSFAATATRRAEAILASLDRDGISPIQPGLFDRRALFAHAALTAEREDTRRWLADRVERLRKSAELVLTPPRLRLVLEPPA